MLHLIFTSVVNIKIPPRNDSYLNLLDYSLTFVHHNVSVYSVIFVNVMFFMQWLGSKMSESSQDGSCDDITAQVITGIPSKDDTSNLQGDPPELNKGLPSFADIKAITKPSKDAGLPVDILLLTVTNCEFLACYSELKNPYRCWFDGLGYVYFSDVGESQEELKVALLRCYRNGIGPGGALVSVKNAASVLRPKAVISVGTCSGLNPAKSKLGDVVVSAKLATYASKVVTSNQEQSTGMRSYVSKRFLDVIKNCADGWQAPLENPEAQQVQVYTDAEFLSGPEQVRAEWRRDQLDETSPQAMAIESEGEGEFTLYSASVSKYTEKPATIRTCFFPS